MNRRQIFAVVVCFLGLVVSVNVANAQSKDQDNPTRLTSNVISGTVGPDATGDKYYYSFVAGPGEVTITLTVEAENVNQVGFALFDEREVMLANRDATAGLVKTVQAVQSVNIPRRQRVLLRIVSMYNSGPGRYRVRISGVVEFNRNKSAGGITGDTPTNTLGVTLDTPTTTLAPTNKLECLPNQGTLIIKMKDGSKKIIDLSEAETITVVP